MWESYGIWIVNDRIVLRSTSAPSKEVIPVSRMFRTNDFAKFYTDIIDGMVFQKKGDDDKYNQIRVLATREGFCMMAAKNKQPFTIHWKKLIQNYFVVPKRE